MVSVGLAIFLAIASEIWKRLTAPKVPQKATDYFFQMAYANNAGIGRPKSNLRDVHNTSTTMPFHVLICADSLHYVGGFRSKQAMRFWDQTSQFCRRSWLLLDAKARHWEIDAMYEICIKLHQHTASHDVHCKLCHMLSPALGVLPEYSVSILELELEVH